ncbi:YgjP-like metallopeptidase domain-containing protein [Lentzea sp. NPDC102401]|uniref:YgjP-like metallopeptidase domain-containing protein n=1 Tax=Lentzea sp. NPDC102401 TaxID=3364128 RepID=UPI0037F48156
MTNADNHLAALAALGLPSEWRTTVALRPQNRLITIRVKSNGAVAVLVPTSATTERVVKFVSERRSWINQQRERYELCAPQYPAKTLVDGETFDLLGRRCLLRLVKTPPAGIHELPAIADEGILYAKRQRPDVARRAITGLYRDAGLAWMQQEGRRYEVDGGMSGPSYAVRNLGRQRWGIYEGPDKHLVTMHWTAFALPMPLVEYVFVHELAHAAQPAGRAHGPQWRQRLRIWMPDWRRRHAELLGMCRHAWFGDCRSGDAPQAPL